MVKCTSCGKSVAGESTTVKFACPECSEIIVRCDKCRQNAIGYKCKKCGFEGP